jgi:hypothetical protein
MRMDSPWLNRPVLEPQKRPVQTTSAWQFVARMIIGRGGDRHLGSVLGVATTLPQGARAAVFPAPWREGQTLSIWPGRLATRSFQCVKMHCFWSNMAPYSRISSGRSTVGESNFGILARLSTDHPVLEIAAGKRCFWFTLSIPDP